jgi:muconolactone D-isomerase
MTHLREVLGDETYESLANAGGNMTTAAMAACAFAQIDQGCVRPSRASASVAREKDYSQQLQQAGKWPHIWRIVSEYANVSIFDVESNEELHALLAGLPLFPYMDVRVTPLATHPSDIGA